MPAQFIYQWDDSDTLKENMVYAVECILKYKAHNFKYFLYF